VDLQIRKKNGSSSMICRSIVLMALWDFEEEINSEIVAAYRCRADKI
jgi:hypothetical protein